MAIDAILTGLFVVAAILTVMSARLLRAAIGLALTSALVTALLFRLNAPIAGVFELSVCAGLIPAILITTIGMTRRLGPESAAERRKEKLRKFWFVPVLVVIIGIVLSQISLPAGVVPAAVEAGPDVREMLWLHRHLDLIGQIAVLLGGVFGVATLVMERKS